jgi:hypothetical protein
LVLAGPGEDLAELGVTTAGEFGSEPDPGAVQTDTDSASAILADAPSNSGGT